MRVEDAVTFAEGRDAAPWLRRYLSCLRYTEILLLQGPPLMGLGFAWAGTEHDKLPLLLFFLPASLLLMAHIFSFNDWAEIAADSRDPNKAGEVFLAKGISRNGVGLLSMGALLASLALMSRLPGPTVCCGVGVAVLGFVYSNPSAPAKGMPVISSLVHLGGGVLHFLFGYSLFAGVDRRGILVALYFSLIFVAGHLIQETRDYEGDRLNGIQTNATRFGQRPMFCAGFLLFTLSYVYLAWLAAAGFVPSMLGLLVLLYPVHAASFWRTLKSELTFQSVSRFQAAYRVLYLLIGVAVVISLAIR
jgi:4-hydroxybenzoate polyprenyltransferase